ncbi:siphovirus ReqiPepy6 Gp37-like family protein [Paenibacillus sp. KR2-11]|uniref:siphovirus ReqiPepy6 Gp37-like family protein n=1 Tax=Paenibacillus sp. KR2-11 TaxID=3385500 RepID=UPI0038FCE85D
MYPIKIFDPNLKYLAEIDNYEFLQWTRRWRSPHAWELQINRNKQNAEYLQADHFIAVQRGGKWRAGRIAHRELPLTENGKLSETWTVKGRDFSGVFLDRLALHGTASGNGYDEQRGIAEEVMRHYVTANCIQPTDPRRVIPFLRQGPNFARGQVVEARGRFQTVAQLLENLCFVTGLGYETVFDLSEQLFTFHVLAGRDLNPLQRTHPPVIFSPEFGNVQRLAFRHSRLDSKNVGIVGGKGEAQDRLIATVSDGQPVGLDRREVFVDARDLETADQLLQRGSERLAEYGEELVMEFEHLQGGPFRYMADFDMGDIVHVNYPGVGSADSRIVEVIEELTPDKGETVRLVVGKEWPDLVSVLRADRKNMDTEVRR